MSVETLPDGRIKVRWRENGIRKSEAAYSKRAAKKRDEEIHARLKVERKAKKLGLLPDDPVAEHVETIASALAHYGKRRRENGWSDGTFSLFQYCSQRLLEFPHIAGARLGELTIDQTDEIRRLLLNRQHEYYAEKHRVTKAEAKRLGAGEELVTKAMGHLKGAIDLARTRHPRSNIPDPFLRQAPRRNGAKRSGVPAVPYEAVELLALTVEGAGFVSKAMSEVLVRLIGDANRPGGEPLGLMWGDRHDQTLSVCRHLADGKIVEKGMHDTRRREVTMSVGLKMALEDWYEECGCPDDNTFILPGKKGRPHWGREDYPNWRERCWEPALHRVVAMAGKDEWMLGLLSPRERELLAADGRPYYLRHCRASILLAAGVSPRDTAYQLGTSTRMLDDTYAHLIERYRVNKTGLVSADEEILAVKLRVAAAHKALGVDPDAEGCG